jgi:hypothetical protein
VQGSPSDAPVSHSAPESAQRRDGVVSAGAVHMARDAANRDYQLIDECNALEGVFTLTAGKNFGPATAPGSIEVTKVGRSPDRNAHGLYGSGRAVRHLAATGAGTTTRIHPVRPCGQE